MPEAQPEEPIVDAEVVPDAPLAEEPDQAPDAPEANGHAGELVHIPVGDGAIIRAEDPDEVIAKATKIANSLKALIEAQGLAVDVGGRRKHVEVGGWQALGSMLGALGGQPLHAETVWSRPARDPDGGVLRHEYHVKETRYRKKSEGGGIAKVIEYDVSGHDWEACVEIRTPGGVVVGRAEAMCSRAEPTWAQRPDPAVRSMAETRAESRAYRRAVGWIVNIAGYNPTPAEEMPPEQAGPPFGPVVEDAAATSAALTYLLDGDQAIAAEVWAEIKAEVEYMPQVVARALVLAARRLYTVRVPRADGRALVTGPERALEVADRLTGEVIDVREAAPEELGAFCENVAQLRGELADAEAVVSAELVRRLDRRGEWTWRVGDPKAGVQYEIKAPSPTAGSTTIDRERLRTELLRLLEEDAIEPALAEAALKRTVTITATVRMDADLDALAGRLSGLDAIADVPVRDVVVSTAEAAAAGGVNRLVKAGHGDVVDDVTVAIPPPARKAKVTAKRREGQA